jgi:hypothetical protein
MHDCKNCSFKKKENQPETIPYIVHESEMDKAEKRAKRILFAMTVSMLLSNLAWLIAFLAR